MGLIVREDAGIVFPLPRRCLIGRGAITQLRLTNRQVSAEHAVVYFHDERWKVRDLGSRNGTLVNGAEVGEARSRILSASDVISFGGSASGQVWRVLSVAAPGPAASGADGELAEAERGTLWLPDVSAAEVSVAYDSGAWILSGVDGPVQVRDGAIVRAAGTSWHLHLPLADAEEALSTGTTRDGGASDVRLEFSVSLDLDHVHMVVTGGSTFVKVGARSFNQALLTLATRRLEDEAAHLPPAEAGWMYADELRSALGLEREGLNLQLWRAIQCFGKAGLSGERLIERRLDTQQLRVGFACSVRSSKGNPVAQKR